STSSTSRTGRSGSTSRSSRRPSRPCSAAAARTDVNRVLVTAPKGFVGTHLRTELGDVFVPYEEDVLDLGSLTTAVRDARPDAVVHLAALSSVADSWGDVTEVWRTNVLGTVNVVEVLR